MSSKNIKIFDQTGCLSEEALTEYAHGKLDIHLRKQVEIHANECDFCRDALEGISLMKNKEAARIAVAQLNTKISGKSGVEQKGGKVIQMNFLRLAAAVLLFFVLGGGVLYLAFNPPFKNEVASNEKEEKVLAENKTNAATDEIATDSIIVNGKLAQSPPDAIVVPEISIEESPKKEPVEGDGFVLVPGTAEIPAAAAITEDMVTDYNKMTATGGASNAAPMYYNPQTGANLQSIDFDTDKYVVNEALAEDDAENTKTLMSVETVSKSKSADKKAQKESEKKNRDEVPAQKTVVQETAAVAYDDLKVAEEKEEVYQARKNIEDQAGAQNADTKVYAFVDEMPQYPGGNEALKKHIRDNIKYPQTAKEQAVSGTVYISYVVNAAGKVTNVKVWKSVSKDLDNEAVRVVSSLKDFTPGKQDGKQVSVQMTVPVKFSLE
ncbi:MAG: hypothetical protein POELPBGB_02739 [Bacteroidia bacterium]|nr:hypothetical protein [Bacteroidia bacterium]